MSPIVDSTATPSAPPTANDVSAIPAARPASSAAAPDTAAIWALTKAAPRPAPNTTRPTTGGSVVSATLPTASSAVPATATARTPARVTTACPAKDPTTEATGHRGGRQPELHRRHARLLRRERQHQQDPVHAHPGHQQQDVPGDEPSRPHHAPRDQRSDRAPLDQDEDRHQQGGGHQRGPRRLRDGQDEEHERRGHGHRAGQVEGARAARPRGVLREQSARRREQQDADRQVDQEDPLPSPQLRDRPAQQQPGRPADPADPAPDAERPVALRPGLERRQQQRQRRRRHDGRTRPLQDARGRRAPPAHPPGPQTSDATVKIAMPTRNTRRRPSRSATRPPNSRSPPNVTR